MTLDPVPDCISVSLRLAMSGHGMFRGEWQACYCLLLLPCPDMACSVRSGEPATACYCLLLLPCHGMLREEWQACYCLLLLPCPDMAYSVRSGKPAIQKSDAARAWIKEAGRMNHLKHSVP